MIFQSQGRPFNDEGLGHVCSTSGVSVPEIWAVLTVETPGRMMESRSKKPVHDPIYKIYSNGRPK